MKNFLFSFVLLFACHALLAAEITEMTLSPTTKIVLANDKQPDGSHYELQYHKIGQPIQRLWRHFIKQQTGSQSEWCGLVSCDSNEETVAIVLERNELSVWLLSIELNQFVVLEHELLLPDMLRKQRMTAAKLRAVAPSSLIFDHPGGKADTLKINNDGSMVLNGESYTEPSVMSISQLNGQWKQTNASTPTSGNLATPNQPFKSPVNSEQALRTGSPKPQTSNLMLFIAGGVIIFGIVVLISEIKNKRMKP